jgi:hypothetical protein
MCQRNRVETRVGLKRESHQVGCGTNSGGGFGSSVGQTTSIRLCKLGEQMAQARRFIVAAALAFAMGGAVRTSFGQTLLYQYGFDNGTGGATGGVEVNTGTLATTGTTAVLTGQGVSAAAGNPSPNGNVDNAYSYGGSVASGYGGNDYASGSLTSDTANLNNVTQVTLSAWVQSTANISGDNARILEINTSTGTDGSPIFFGFNAATPTTNPGVTGNGYHLQVEANGQNPNGGTVAASGTTGNITAAQVGGGSTSTYQFVAFTLDMTKTSGNLNFYTGGLSAAVSLMNTGGGSFGSSVNLSSDYIVVGNRTTDGGRGFPGLIDDIQIWNGILSQSSLETIRETDVNAAATPEPATLGLLSLGGLALLHRRRRMAD